MPWRLHVLICTRMVVREVEEHRDAVSTGKAAWLASAVVNETDPDTPGSWRMRLSGCGCGWRSRVNLIWQADNVSVRTGARSKVHVPIRHHILPSNMASFLPRAAKRARLAANTHGWVCKDCCRSFTSSVRQPQQQQPASSQHVKQDEKTTHFGFETVSESLKASRGIYTI